MAERAEKMSASEWWSKRRLRYNLGLVISGVLAFMVYVALVLTFKEKIPEAEITAFTVTFQAVGYLVAIGIANICYFIGPLSERIMNPRNVATYRTTTYNLGFWFSVLVPFSIPVLVSYVIVTSA